MKTWCEHILYAPKIDFEFIMAGIHAREIMNWDVCPIKGCGAKRPDEPQKLWEKMSQSLERDAHHANMDIDFEHLAKTAVEHFKGIVDEIKKFSGSAGYYVDVDNLKARLDEDI